MFDAADRTHLVGAGQTQGQAALARAAGSADAMHMGLGFRRDVDVHDGGQAGDVQAARGDIGGHQHRAAAVDEAHQYLIALALLQVAVQGQRAVALRLKGLNQFAATCLGVAKSQRTDRTQVGEQGGHGRQPLLFAHFVPALLDLFAVVLGLNLDRDRLAQELRGQLGDALWVSGRKQQGLALSRALAGHHGDVFSKTHVQHAVGLIEDQRLQAVQL